MSSSRLWITLTAQFKASPGKSGLLCVLALTLVVIVARQFIRSPRTAGAADLATAFQDDPTLIPEAVPASARPARQPLPSLPGKPARDLFQADWSLFATRRWMKPDTSPGEVENPVKDAPVLNLELTLTLCAAGGSPQAVISGKCVRVGDVIHGFVVESISPAQVILSNDKRERIALHMD
ncbi:MAG: hypothetical protein KAV82_06195 [Phycisphaerae bacterium]|nr:hypothetical protein [Phycisphaerae bacterium]